MASLYRFLADLVLVVHFAIVLLVVGGLLLIAIGGLLQWRWVRNAWFRLGHLGAIAFVIAESWLGVDCPLTTLELWLRQRAGQTDLYAGNFLAYWIYQFMFFTAPPWVFAVCYTLFGGLVLLCWKLFPPRFPPRRRVS